VTIAAIALVFSAVTPEFAGPVGAIAVRSTHPSELRARSSSGGDVAARPLKKKAKKKVATGLMSKLQHAVLVLLVLAVVVLALFLIGSGVRGPRGRKHRRARDTAG
jgi:hypothetical protein